MRDHAPSSDELIALLERIRLPLAGPGATSPEVSQAQVDVLLARIAALTGTLREAAPGETAHLAARLLLSDLALVAASFRGRTNEAAAALTAAIESASALMQDLDSSASPARSG